MTTIIKSYSELIQLPSFIERYRYLKLCGTVGDETFGYDRYINQRFYKSDKWLKTRANIIIRDAACDLAMNGREVDRRIIIHHINPITKDDILNMNSILFDPENLICTTKRTHDAIHYGDENLLFDQLIERTKNDTCPWRR